MFFAKDGVDMEMARLSDVLDDLLTSKEYQDFCGHMLCCQRHLSHDKNIK